MNPDNPFVQKVAKKMSPFGSPVSGEPENIVAEVINSIIALADDSASDARVPVERTVTPGHAPLGAGARSGIGVQSGGLPEATSVDDASEEDAALSECDWPNCHGEPLNWYCSDHSPSPRDNATRGDSGDRARGQVAPDHAEGRSLGGGSTPPPGMSPDEPSKEFEHVLELAAAAGVSASVARGIIANLKAEPKAHDDASDVLDREPLVLEGERRVKEAANWLGMLVKGKEAREIAAHVLDGFIDPIAKWGRSSDKAGKDA